MGVDLSIQEKLWGLALGWKHIQTPILFGLLDPPNTIKSFGRLAHHLYNQILKMFRFLGTFLAPLETSCYSYVQNHTKKRQHFSSFLGERGECILHLCTWPGAFTFSIYLLQPMIYAWPWHQIFWFVASEMMGSQLRDLRSEPAMLLFLLLLASGSSSCSYVPYHTLQDGLLYGQAENICEFFFRYEILR